MDNIEERIINAATEEELYAILEELDDMKKKKKSGFRDAVSSSGVKSRMYDTVYRIVMKRRRDDED